MYYNSNNNNDYYNSYKRELAELKAYDKEENTQKVIKVILLLLTFTLIGLSTFYLYKYFNPKIEQVLTKNKPLASIVIREEELPQSIQLRESNMQTPEAIQRNATDSRKVQKVALSMSEKDIALIVQTIMLQMNVKKEVLVKEVPLAKQLQEIANKQIDTQTLEKANHYNKVILTKNKVINVQNASLMELSTNIDRIINEGIDTSSTYSQEITKEVHFRENEMRIIIVQKGDTLSRIAKKAYGDYDDYPKIFAANPQIIKNPNQIFVGQRLRIPV